MQKSVRQSEIEKQVLLILYILASRSHIGCWLFLVWNGCLMQKNWRGFHTKIISNLLLSSLPTSLLESFESWQSHPTSHHAGIHNQSAKLQLLASLVSPSCIVSHDILACMLLGTSCPSTSAFLYIARSWLRECVNRVSQCNQSASTRTQQFWQRTPTTITNSQLGTMHRLTLRCTYTL